MKVSRGVRIQYLVDPLEIINGYAIWKVLPEDGGVNLHGKSEAVREVGLHGLFSPSFLKLLCPK
ncbi:hypothetical protein EFQ43_13325 [Limosilactobacillus fermentum]|nr:hypothetical protein [Limosilactobacillus fermentum]